MLPSEPTFELPGHESLLAAASTVLHAERGLYDVLCHTLVASVQESAYNGLQVGNREREDNRLGPSHWGVSDGNVRHNN